MFRVPFFVFPILEFDKWNREQGTGNREQGTCKALIIIHYFEKPDQVDDAV